MYGGGEGKLHNEAKLAKLFGVLGCIRAFSPELSLASERAIAKADLYSDWLMQNHRVYGCCMEEGRGEGGMVMATLARGLLCFYCSVCAMRWNLRAVHSERQRESKIFGRNFRIITRYSLSKYYSKASSNSVRLFLVK